MRFSSIQAVESPEFWQTFFAYFATVAALAWAALIVILLAGAVCAFLDDLCVRRREEEIRARYRLTPAAADAQRLAAPEAVKIISRSAA